MALQKTITIPKGTNLSSIYSDFEYCVKKDDETLQNAYIKIDSISGSKEMLSIAIGIYKSKEGVQILNKNYSFVPSVTDDSSNFIKQGYEYLKTLEEYTDVVDC